MISPLALNAVAKQPLFRNHPMTDNMNTSNAMNTPLGRRRTNLKHRRGAVLGLLAILLPVLAILSAFCINTAHMQLTRTELMVATDAAARAGGRTLSETQNVNSAKTAARTTAAMNNVNGEPLQIRTGDDAGEIQFGNAVQLNGQNSRFLFTAVPTSLVASGQARASAFRVKGRRDNGSLSGRVPLVIPGVLNQTDFSTLTEAVAMQVDRDIVLVVDRSGSMGFLPIAWSSSENPFGNRSVLDAGVTAGLLRTSGLGSYWYQPGVQSYEYEQWAYSTHFNRGVAPLAPWQDLKIAVDAFLNVLDETIQSEQVALVTYESSSTLDSVLEYDYDIIRTALEAREPFGGTGIGGGMQRGMQAFDHGNARPHASKTMVVMTDGNENVYPWSRDVATSIVASNNITIHTVTFGTGANQRRMREVAEIGGGSHYHASSGAQLVSVFEEIANNLPTILTE